MMPILNSDLNSGLRFKGVNLFPIKCNVVFHIIELVDCCSIEIYRLAINSPRKHNIITDIPLAGLGSGSSSLCQLLTFENLKYSCDFL
jgi:hypothetical protein